MSTDAVQKRPKRRHKMSIIMVTLAIIAVAVASSFPGMRAAVHGALGVCCQALGWSKMAESRLNKSLSLFKSLDNKGGMAQAYMNLGEVALTRGDLDKAEAMLEQSLELSRDEGRMARISGDLFEISRRYTEQGVQEKAEILASKSLALEESLGNKEAAAKRYGALGAISEMRGDLAKSEAMYSKALVLFDDIGDKMGMAITHRLLGLVYLDRGHLDQAEVELTRSLSLLRALKGLDDLALGYRLLGLVFQQRGDTDKARTVFNEYLSVAEPTGDKNFIAAASNDLAWFLATCPDGRGRDGKKAVESATRACELTGWNNATCLDCLAAACAESGDFDAAVRWQEKALRLLPMDREPQRMDLSARLALYQARKPYREEFKAKRAGHGLARP